MIESLVLYVYVWFDECVAIVKLDFFFTLPG